MSQPEMDLDGIPNEPPSKRARVQRSLPPPPPPLPGARDSADTLNDDCLLHMLSYVPVAELFAMERVCPRWRIAILGVYRGIRTLSIVACEAFYCHCYRVDPPEKVNRVGQSTTNQVTRRTPHAEPSKYHEIKTTKELSKCGNVQSEEPLLALHKFVSKFNIPLLDPSTRLLLRRQLDESAREEILARFPHLKRLELVVNLLGRAAPQIRALLIKYQKELVHLKVITVHPQFHRKIGPPVHWASAWRHLGWSINKCRALRHLSVYDANNEGLIAKPLTRKHGLQNLKQLEELYVDDWFGKKNAFSEGIKRLGHFTKLKAFGTLSSNWISDNRADDQTSRYCEEVCAVLCRLKRLIYFEEMTIRDFAITHPLEINFVRRLTRMRSTLAHTLTTLQLNGIAMDYHNQPERTVSLVNALAKLTALEELRFDYSSSMFSVFANQQEFADKKLPVMAQIRTLQLDCASLPHREFALACLIWPYVTAIKFNGYDQHCQAPHLDNKSEHICEMPVQDELDPLSSCEGQLCRILQDKLKQLSRIFLYRNGPSGEDKSMRPLIKQNGFGVKYSIKYLDLLNNIVTTIETQHWIVEPKFVPLEL